MSRKKHAKNNGLKKKRSVIKLHIIISLLGLNIQNEEKNAKKKKNKQK